MPARRLQLSVLPGRFSVCRLDPAAPIPEWLPKQGFVSVTRTTDELSIVCDGSCVPRNVKAQPGWIVMNVRGLFKFSEAGVLAALADPLAKAGISVFAISTFDTDHLLVAEEGLDQAEAALTAAGHTILRSAGK